MYNTQKPNLDELPSSARLLKSTIIAAVAALAILLTIILPAEYGIDPTGVGTAIGLSEMGEIKSQLAEEAEQDRIQPHDGDKQSSLFVGFLNFFVGTVYAQDSASNKTDEITFTLSPGEGIEIKLVMQESAEVEYRWVASGGLVNFDLHGHGGGQKISYEKGRGVPSSEGTLIAKFAGNHGWFWRNRDKQDVSVTLSVSGNYESLKR